ncbi:MAG: putative quinol monooxygenase [Pseudomonadota bacterium]
MIVVSGNAKFAPGALQKIRKEMEAMITASKAEAGCIDYAYGIDVSDPDTLLVVEYWEDWAALDAHFKEPHMATWRAALGAAGVLSRDIKAAEMDGVRAL